MIQFGEHIFQRGRNHQLESSFSEVVGFHLPSWNIYTVWKKVTWRSREHLETSIYWTSFVGCSDMANQYPRIYIWWEGDLRNLRMQPLGWLLMFWLWGMWHNYAQLVSQSLLALLQTHECTQILPPAPLENVNDRNSFTPTWHTWRSMNFPTSRSNHRSIYHRISLQGRSFRRHFYFVGYFKVCIRGCEIWSNWNHLHIVYIIIFYLYMLYMMITINHYDDVFAYATDTNLSARNVFLEMDFFPQKIEIYKKNRSSQVTCILP